MNQIKMQFLLEINRVTEEFLKEACGYAQENLDKVVGEGIGSLQKAMDGVLKEYQLLRQAERVGTLRWIYLSFLHTGMIDDVLRYRIDLYDDRDRMADTECAVNWDIPYFSECFSVGKKKLRDQFERQSQARGYEMDSFTGRIMKRLRQEADSLMPEIIKSVLEEADLGYLGEEPVIVKAGELFDYANPVLIWDRSGVRPWEAE